MNAERSEVATMNDELGSCKWLIIWFIERIAGWTIMEMSQRIVNHQMVQLFGPICEKRETFFTNH